MTDLDRLDALAAAATPGPWVQSHFVDGREYEHMSKPWKDARQAEEVRMVRAGGAKGQHVALAQDPWNAEADAAFIAACDPATIRSLVAAVRERDELRAVANDAADTMHAGTGAMAATLPVILAVRAWRDTPRDPKRPRVNAELEQAVMDAINDFDEYAARLREDGAS